MHSYRNDGRSIVLHQFNYTFEAGRVYVIMGPNGCGKSTLLRVLVGDLPLDSGNVAFICQVSAHKQMYEFLPQDYRQALFPWKTLVSNVWPWLGHPGNLPGTASNAVISEASTRALALLGVEHLGGRFPHDLSGGQQQIALLARCIVSDARILILDEPFSALDVVRRSRIAHRLREVWVNTGRIVICAMHEPDEAATLADEVTFFDGPPLTRVHVVSRAAYSDNAGCVDLNAFRSGIADALTRVVEKGGQNA